MTTHLLPPQICRQQHSNPPCFLLRRLFESAISRYIKWSSEIFSHSCGLLLSVNIAHKTTYITQRFRFLKKSTAWKFKPTVLEEISEKTRVMRYKTNILFFGPPLTSLRFAIPPTRKTICVNPKAICKLK